MSSKGRRREGTPRRGVYYGRGQSIRGVFEFWRVSVYEQRLRKGRGGM